MAKTKTRKAKLRGGTNTPEEPEIIPLDDLLEAESAADAEANGDGWPDKTYIDGVNIDRPLPVTVAVEAPAETSENIPNGKPDHTTLDPAKAYDSPERLAEWDRLTVVILNQSANECAEYRAQYEDKAEVAKEAKKKLDLAVADHFKLIDDRRTGRGKPQQGTIPFPDPERNGHAAAEADLREPSEVPPVTDESWKAVPLAELVEKDGLPAKVAQLLGDAGICTMGELAAHTEPKASGWTDKLTDIPGIGPKKAEEIDAATAAFWARWRPHVQATAEDKPGTDEGVRHPDPGVDEGQRGDGQPEGAGDRPAGGDPAAQAEPEPAGKPKRGRKR
jgi:predicted flap endonuclease-1-like 5' DNA nuclease